MGNRNAPATEPGQSIVQSLLFEREAHGPPVTYTLTLLSGQGNP
jgi:hypothetical protein